MENSLSKAPFGALHHVGFTISDIDRSIAFYECLGFVVASRWCEGPELCARGLGVEGSDIELVQMRRDGFVLELIAFRQPRENDPDPSQIGNAHLAFSVADIDATCAELAALGGRLVSEVIRHPEADWAQLIDPDGIRIEILMVHGQAN
ncbi:MAG: VOC family protein [Rhizobiaceae bacterium]|nr:VOC family protein [Rhizobiaceae bacterium]